MEDGIASARIAAAPDKNPSKIEPGCHNFALSAACSDYTNCLPRSRTVEATCMPRNAVYMHARMSEWMTGDGMAAAAAADAVLVRTARRCGG